MYPHHYIRLLLTLFVCLAFKPSGAQVPVAQFTANVTQGCAPLSVRFTDQSSGSPQFWNWDFGNGQLSNLQNPTVNFSTPGTYTITLVVRNQDGVDGETKTGFITVYPSPTAAFESNLQEGCLGSTIRFRDRSSDAAGSITAWSWDFGDGTTSTQQNPSKQYTANGFYTVTLTVTSSTGCRRTVSRGRYIRILSGITNEFRHAQDSVCRAPFPVRFTNESSGPGTLSYNWNFGNGTGSTEKDPVATYNAPGNYNITLVTTSAFGCSETLTRSITVTGATPAITAGAVACLQTPFSFTNSSNPAPVSSTWDFGDGNTSSETSPTHTYTTAGAYQVKLVTDFGYCKDSVIHPLTVAPRPTVNFSATNRAACSAPLTTNFTAIAPGAVSWNWDFGDGNTSTLQNPSHTYTANASYNVTLTITNANGCTNTITQDAFVQIRQPQISAASLEAGGCAPFTYTPAASISTVVPVSSWLWDFGDGSTSNAPNPSHVYPAPGNYTVTLTVGGSGCNTTLTATNAVRVGTSPGASFTSSATQSCVSSNIQFTNTSTQSDAWEWDFGDGTTSNVENPTHAYTEPGLYTIRFTAVNNGCRETITQTDYISILPPLARFDFAVLCPDFRNVAFTNNSITDNTTLPITYLWEFGDPAGTTDASANPTFLFPSIGAYNVALTVTNGTCTHRVTREVIITTQPADVAVSNNNACKHERITVSAINSDPALIRSYEWSIDGGTPFTAGRSFDTSFATNGNYTISLTLTDINGCITNLGTPVSIAVTGPVASFNASNTGACVNGDITLTSTATSANGISRYRWDFGDGNITDNSTASIVHQYAASGNYLPSLTVADTRGCTDTAFLPVALQITSPKAGFEVSDTLFCPTLPVQFTDTSSGYNLSYLWDFGNGNTSTDQHPTNEFRGGDATYSVSLEVTDGYGCTDLVRKENLVRIVNPVAVFTVSDSLFLCAPAEVQFTNQSTGYEELLWDFNNDNTSTLENPNQFFNTIGNYNVKLYAYGYGGCVDSAIQAIRFPDPGTTVMNYSPITACNEITVDFTIAPIEGLSYNFLFGNGQDTTGTTSFSYHYGSPGTYAPRITYTDRMGCIASVGGPSTIRVSGAIVAFAKDRRAFCDNGTVNFTNYTIPLAADPISALNWDFGDGGTSTDPNPSHSFTRPGTFPVLLNVSTQAGCVSTFSDTIRVYRTPAPIINTLPGVCVFDTLDINGTLAFADTSITWNWSLNGGNLTGPQHRVTFSTPGTVTANLTASNLLNCTGSTSATIEVYPLPQIQVPPNITVPSGGSAPLLLSYSAEVSSWTWTPANGLSCTNCAQPVASPQFNTTYTVAVTDQNGCINSTEVPVTVICNNLNFFIPNTFSPNNDGTNDVFYPRGRGIERIASLRIFNRWGQLMFEKRNFGANDPAMGWNGTFQGKPVSSDTYVYVVELICENATTIPYKGNVTLIR